MKFVENETITIDCDIVPLGWRAIYGEFSLIVQ
jgi:hypothetical protein